MLPIFLSALQVRSDWYVYIVLSALPWVSQVIMLHSHVHLLNDICYYY